MCCRYLVESVHVELAVVGAEAPSSLCLPLKAVEVEATKIAHLRLFEQEEQVVVEAMVPKRAPSSLSVRETRRPRPEQLDGVGERESIT